MIAATSQWVAIGLGVWLIGLGGLMFVAPRRALGALGRMGSSGLIHCGEMALRILAGGALVVAAGASRFPPVISIIGWFLMVSAVILLMLPRRWHAAYSTWWAGHIPVTAVRLVAPVSWLMGGALIWAML